MTETASTGERLLEALDALLAGQPWRKLSLGAVAKQAGVSRQTVYNEFGDREGLARAYVLREAERLLAAPVEAFRRNVSDPRAAVAEALAVFLAEARDNHLLEAARAGEDEGQLLAMLTIQGQVLSLAAARLDAVVRQTWPGIDAAGSYRVMEIVVRLAISHSNMPAGTPEEAAADLAAVVGAELERLVATGGEKR